MIRLVAHDVGCGHAVGELGARGDLKFLEAIKTGADVLHSQLRARCLELEKYLRKPWRSWYRSTYSDPYGEWWMTLQRFGYLCVHVGARMPGCVLPLWKMNSTGGLKDSQLR